MGSWFRSEEMTYVSLIVEEDAAPSFIREVGSLGCIQFSDLNPDLTPFQRPYVSYIKRCDEIERKIRYLHSEVKLLSIPVAEAGNVDDFLETNTQQTGLPFIESLEASLGVYESQLIELNSFGTKLSQEYIRKVMATILLCNGLLNEIVFVQVEYHNLLKKSIKFAAAHLPSIVTPSRRVVDDESGIVLSPMNDATFPDMLPFVDSSNEMVFSTIGGTISTADRDRFYRTVFRATRGNCMIRFSSLGDRANDALGNHIYKVCFIMFFKSAAMEVKLKRICDAFAANRYDVSAIHNADVIRHLSQQNQREMKDTKTILEANIVARFKIGTEVAVHLETWLWSIRREKSIYHTMNLLKNDVAAGHFLHGRGWVLTAQLPRVTSILKRTKGSKSSSASALIEPVKDPWPTPPTHFTTNKYTWAFQEFVNTYGIPRYREANPALFTAATFPFFFGVMYGDIGHGSILSMAALYLILTESKARSRGMDEMLAGLYSARYMLFAMGLMAVYAGFIYNDYFALGLNLLGSRYEFTEHVEGAKATHQGTYGDSATVYPFGVDPAWKLSGNELLFYNSMKMKMSVILGIFHMTFGILLRGLNCWYFQSTLDLVCEFIPMLLFALSLFGYMVVMIFVKWSIDWNHRMALGTCAYSIEEELGACELSTATFCYNAAGKTCTAQSPLSEVCTLGYGGTSGGCQPPNLITTLINMALTPGTVDEPMYAGQASVQTFLLLIAFVSVPWLLFAKPMYLRYRHYADVALRNQPPSAAVADDRLIHRDPEPGHSESHSHGHSHEEGEEFEFGEIVIHQAIETIEFVLSMVSNTASYLRLWALSLAHTELATVFWENAMLSALNTGNAFTIVCGYAVFAAVTFGVLLAMDVLECFLHALRLHWVEFQSKFYKADGYRFQPFSFQAILDKTMLE